LRYFFERRARMLANRVGGEGVEKASSEEKNQCGEVWDNRGSIRSSSGVGDLGRQSRDDAVFIFFGQHARSPKLFTTTTVGEFLAGKVELRAKLARRTVLERT
jgi:hypothetical protein